MKTLIGQLWRIVLISSLGLAGSMIAGLLIYGGSIFGLQSVGFAYIAYGLSGSFIFSVYHVRGLSDTVTAAVSFSALQLIVGSFWFPIWNAVIWSFGVNLTMVLLAFLFERKLSHMRQWKFVAVGLIYGALFVVLTLLVGLITAVPGMPPTLFRDNFLDGLLMGLGIGLGVEVAESIIHSIEMHREAMSDDRKG